MQKPDYLISTPENVDLHLELAGLGNRILAAVLDHLLIGAVLFATIAVCVGIGLGIENTPLPAETKTTAYWWLAGIGLFFLFIVNFGYFIFFEGTWHGLTPGKKVAGIRVIEANGQPVSWGSVFIRNLMRIIDELPGLYPGLIPMMLDKNERRLGDFAAGTLVIRERMPSLSTSGLNVSAAARKPDLFVDTGQISPERYSMLIGFLKRRGVMNLSERQRLASDMTDRFRSDLLMSENTDSPELFLEKLYVAYNQRGQADIEEGRELR